MNMQEKIRKIVPSLLILVIFVLLVFWGRELIEAVGFHASSHVYLIFDYVVQIGGVLSGAILFTTIMNVMVWDDVIVRMLGTSIPRLVKDLFAIVIFVVAVTIIVGFIFEREVIGIWATSSVIGVILGFALRTLILDFCTAIAINMDRSYKIGDWVHVHARNRVEYIGYIQEINRRTTRLRTTDNNIIVVPNNIMGQSVVTNFSAPDTLSRLELLFHLDFAIPTERALRVILAGVKQAVGSEGIEGEPEPKVKINYVTDIGVEYRVRYWLYPEKISLNRARHLVIQHVLYNLRIAGISLAYPKQDVYYARMPTRDLNAQTHEDTLAILASIDLFSSLTPEALQLLADNLKTVTFAPSEPVVTVGEQGDSMFILIEGLLDVYIYSEDKQEKLQVNYVTAGQFFGEMALLTGEPRSATVVAATDVVGYEITRDNMMPLVNTYPDVLETMSKIVAERHMQQQHLLETRHTQALTEETQRLTDELLRRIKRFFGLRRETGFYRRRAF